MDHLPFDHICPFGVPRAERIRGEGDSGHLDAALHDCLPHDHQSPCRPLRRHRSSVSTTPRLSLPSLYCALQYTAFLVLCLIIHSSS
ncbi:hypothetical protein O3P69_011688 [Scylla paramamosain]|uniref:Uncharacterized protein n=1 Tax=Scylla paramamosain TaxID=85552 RepID=A0AAW0SG42_SCYPA